MSDRPRRRPRLSLRALIVLIAALAVVLGLWIGRARRQRALIDWVERHDGIVSYAHQYDEATGGYDRERGPRVPGWLRQALGDEYFVTTRRVAVGGFSRDPADAIGGEELARLVRLARSVGLAGLYLYCREWDLGEDDLEPLASLGGLEVLEIESVDLSGVDLAPLGDLSGLESLRLTRTTLGDGGLRFLERLTGLERLLLYQTDVGDEDLHHLAGLGDLEWLSLHGTEVTGAGLRHLVGLRGLEWLDLGETRVGGAGGLRYLAGLGRLEELDLQGTEVVDDDLRHLAGLGRLRKLDLMSTAVSDAGLAYLSGLTSLEELYLRGTRVTDAGLRHLAGLEHLERLDLMSTAVGDEAVAAIAALPADRVNLHQTYVTARGAARLRRLRPDLDLYHPAPRTPPDEGPGGDGTAPDDPDRPEPSP